MVVLCFGHGGHAQTEKGKKQPKEEEEPAITESKEPVMVSSFAVASPEFQNLRFRLRHKDSLDSRWFKFDDFNLVRPPTPGNEYFFEVKKEPETILSLKFESNSKLTISADVIAQWSKFERLWIGLSLLAINGNNRYVQLLGWKIGTISYVGQTVLWLNATGKTLQISPQRGLHKQLLPDIVASQVEITPILRPVIAPVIPDNSTSLRGSIRGCGYET